MKDIKNIVKNIKNKMKQFDKVKVMVIVIILIIIILFIINTIITIIQNKDYEQRVQSGNDRWLQVENILEDTNNKIYTLENKVNDIELKLKD